jgi:centrin-1
VEEGKGEIDFN